MIFAEIPLNDHFSTKAGMYPQLHGQLLIKTSWNKARQYVVSKNEPPKLSDEFIFNGNASVTHITKETLNILLGAL